jgi:CBS domain-containing protein
MPQIDAYPEVRLHHRRRVEDVMTTEVVTVDTLAPYKEVARLLAEYRVSAARPFCFAGELGTEVLWCW